MVLYKVRHGVYAPVNGTGCAKVLHGGPRFCFCGFNSRFNKLGYTLVFGGAYGNGRHTQKLGYKLYINRSAVTANLVHHIKRQNHRNIQFQKLHGQIQVALNVRRIHDIDDSLRVLLQNKLTRHQLLIRIWR